MLGITDPVETPEQTPEQRGEVERVIDLDAIEPMNLGLDDISTTDTTALGMESAPAAAAAEATDALDRLAARSHPV